MSKELIVFILVAYFAVLLFISYLTSRNADSNTFFTGNKQSPWYLVAFGMIGASLSGVTFISVPGKVASDGFQYFQVVMGYTLGYLVIAKLLMPLYYRLNVTSIYQYLDQRLGVVGYKTGAGFFVLSRTLGSAIRLYLATLVLQIFLFDDWNVPYWATAILTISLIWVYTFKGGIKTIVYTDTFQTFFLISSVILCSIYIASELKINWFDLYERVSQQQTTTGFSMSRIFQFEDPLAKNYFFKHFFGGMFLTIAMTGLDQDLMQKNLTCRNIEDAQKNMYSFTVVLVFTNFLFLLVGGALYVFAAEKGIELPSKSDHVFPTLALSHFGTLAGIFFLLGITASSYASADSALAALTTGFCIDFLNFEKRTEASRQKWKFVVHIGFSILFLFIILGTKYYVDRHPETDIISLILTVAGYTYGPLIGLFSFGLFTRRMPIPFLLPIVTISVPFLCYYLDKNAPNWLNGYQFGFEILILNGFITFLLLLLFSKPKTTQS
jgi:SSS family transporter